MGIESVVSIMALVVSIFSLITTIYFAYVTLSQNKMMNKTNLKASYYHVLFDDYLIGRIPKAYKKLNFVNNKLIGGKDISLICTDLLKDIMYFKFIDKVFYDKLEKAVEDIEDYVLMKGNEEYIQEKQAMVYEEISKRINHLYSLINDSYVGENNKKKN